MKYDLIRNFYLDVYEALAEEGMEMRKSLRNMDHLLIQDFAHALRRRKNRRSTCEDISRDIFGTTMNRDYKPRLKNSRKEKS